MVGKVTFYDYLRFHYGKYMIKTYSNQVKLCFADASWENMGQQATF